MQRRPDRPMYIPPGKRNRSIAVPDMIIDENISSDDSDKILNILDFFSNLNSVRMKEFGSHLIDFSLVLIQKQSYKKDVMEKLTVTLNLVGPSLDQSHSKQLDSLLFVIRDHCSILL